MSEEEANIILYASMLHPYDANAEFKANFLGFRFLSSFVNRGIHPETMVKGIEIENKITTTSTIGNDDPPFMTNNAVANWNAA